MSILPQLERDLRDAALRRGRGAERQPRAAGARSVAARLRVLALSPVALLAGATIALAATGVILTGSPVGPRGPQIPTAGLGTPATGGSQLLALRVPDPDGGLPWGMRIVRTTRGELCLQVGRVQDSQLGVLGTDGAFADDGRFHPLPPSALSTVLTSDGESFDVECQEPPIGTNASVVSDGGSGGVQIMSIPVPIADGRLISYGVLGPNAVSFSYRDGASTPTVSVDTPDGAYLIVQTASGGKPYSASSFGIDRTHGELLNPTGALLGVTYRIGGRLCSNQPIEGHPACPRPDFTPPPGPRKTAQHERLHPVLSFKHGKAVALTIHFTAPFAVTSAAQDYMFVAQACPPKNANDRDVFQVTGLNRDVRAGATVTLTVPDPFAGACESAITASVTYTDPGAEENLAVGTATIARP